VDRIFQPKLSRREAGYLKRIRGLFPTESPIELEVRAKSRPYGLPQQKLRLNCQVGPALSVSEGLCHEIGHLLEIDDARVCEPGWGLRLPTHYLLGQSWSEPRTVQSILRECRVIAWQTRLLETVSAPFNPFRFSGSLQYMPDYCLIPISRRAKTLEGTDRRRNAWIHAQIREALRTITKERVLPELRRKIGVVGETLRA